jgi:lipopolysaccharide transport system permease protein
LKIKIGFIAILLPFYLFEIFIFSLGVSFLLSSLYPKYRELQHIWSLLLLIGFWVTPIIYSEKMVPEKYLKYYMLNPLARLINETRDILIYHYSPEIKQMMITFFICIGIFIIGFLFFKKREAHFAEEL